MHWNLVGLILEISKFSHIFMIDFYNIRNSNFSFRCL